MLQSLSLRYADFELIGSSLALVVPLGFGDGQIGNLEANLEPKTGHDGGVEIS